ncbi:hypothetical protein K7X08_037996 [Anisodus acutangulus]|uniref:Uncharacterized protein n=1 Tax=Anisodus acutangulus TaxID=402998 RepID=A0A9Q1MXH2_9SOLA|nr:hypothetical protein K7X08_037996 [Anisodus acutangulus]
MHGNIEEQNKIDHKARTAIEIAMAQGGGEVGSTSGGQPTGAQTVAGKGRTTLAAQPVGPSARDGKGGNNDRESKVTPDEDGYMEVKRKGKPKGHINRNSKSRTQPTAAPPTLVQPAEQVTKGNGKMDEKLGVEAKHTTMANSFDIDFPVLPNRSTHVTKEYITITPLPGGRPCGVGHSGQPVTSAQRYPKAIAGNIGKAQ